MGCWPKLSQVNWVSMGENGYAANLGQQTHQAASISRARDGVRLTTTSNKKSAGL